MSKPYRMFSPPFRGYLPWTRTTDKFYATPDEAYEAAAAWCEAYRKADVYGNMADVLGVHKREETGVQDEYVGVITYFHSNT